MLLRILAMHLRPYRPQLALILLLQFIGTMAALYLPSLNADIIDNGVARGDTGYITSTGALMLGVSLVQILCSSAAVYVGARTAMAFGPPCSTGSARSRAASSTTSVRLR
jgi:ATP-binding cassette, subfamily B, multidrug efflux pump